MIILKDVYDIRTQLLGNKSKLFPITQKYGWTPFALKMKKRFEDTGLQLYKYGIHPGLDLGIKLKIMKSPIHGIVLVDDDANDSGRGIALSIWDEKQLFAFRIYHLNANMVYEGQEIYAEQDVGISGRTAGKLTIGNEWHAHIEGVMTDKEGYPIGPYGGAIDLLNESLVRWVA